MKAIQVFETGGPEVLKYVDVAIPVPGLHEALIKIEACGVNFIDTYFREGRYPASLPFTLGQEAAGVVESVGAEVTSVKPGDKVAWCGVPGTYAEYAVAPADRLVHVPDGLTTKEAAAAMLQGMTAHYLAQTTYVIHAGDTVLVHAGAGGVGLLLTQMAKRLGAWVITTVSTEEKAELSREAGADEVIFYNQEPFDVAVRRITEGVGVPVVYDSVGKTTFEQSLKCLAPLGMLVLYGGSSGPVPPFDLMRLSQMGSLFITRPTLKDYIGPRKYLDWRASDVLGWVGEGRLKLRLEHTYSLADATQAHLDLEARKTTGKILLIP